MGKQVINKSKKNHNNICDEKKTYTLLVDGNNLLKSSLVDKTRLNSEGEEYGAVFLFLRRLGNILVKRDFSRCIVVWDGNNDAMQRIHYLPEYKANRRKDDIIQNSIYNAKTEYDRQIAKYCKKVLEYHKNKESKKVRDENDDEIFQRERYILQTMLEELFVRQHMYDETEGDDIIAYYCKNRKEGEYIYIVSEDRDLSQLINDHICVFLPSKKIFVSTYNDKEILGIPAYNVALKKIICGDSSDNIKGVKGWGETTLVKYYPRIKTDKCDLNDFLSNCRNLIDDRKKNKKPALKCLDNALNKVTDGSQGKNIYEINEKIINLSEPLLSEEVKKDIDDTNYSPIDPSDRDLKNVYRIISKNGMTDMLDEHKFGNLFSYFERIRKTEIEYFKKCSNM